VVLEYNQQKLKLFFGTETSHLTAIDNE